MKKMSLRQLTGIGTVLLLTGGTAAAQGPEGGYWVTESVTKPERVTLVRFYDADHRPLYAEKIPGRCLNIRRKRVVQSLNRSLQLVQAEWGLRRSVASSELVAQQLRR